MNKKIFVAVVSAALLAGCSEEQSAEKAPRPVRTTVVHLQDAGETIVQTGKSSRGPRPR
ncbi:lipoprotein [Brucella anthropi]|uniref:lipoprotein n=1 Tax=Brucella anthropi TaxID=529 RepID=UPI003EE0D132